MFEAISDISSETQPTVRFKPSPYATPRIAGNRTADYEDFYIRLVKDPRYRHFVRIPARIVRCLDYFQVGCDRDAAARILGTYYLFIGVVDNAVDSGRLETAGLVFHQLAISNSEPVLEFSDVAMITERLKRQINDNVNPIFQQQLMFLYENVRQERSVDSMEGYVEVRRAVGRLTADLSYVLISSLFDREYRTLRKFMQRVGAVGCLVDSVIDLRADERQGLLNFRPTFSDHFKLALVTLFEGVSIGWEHPRLTGLFALAILDNIRDRFPVSLRWK